MRYLAGTTSFNRNAPFGSGGGIVYSGDLINTLKSARDDYDVLALVLRIDSPGGSAVASEEILRGVELLRADGIPVVVSMGSTAASGGYYIACTADSIFADESTITASTTFSPYPRASAMTSSGTSALARSGQCAR